LCTKLGTPLDITNAGKAFKRVLKHAELPRHSRRPARHTFASLLLQQGESPANVQRQLGYASIQLMLDTDAGSRWATRRPSTASTTRLKERVVASDRKLGVRRDRRFGTLN
jgi:hypothetical protein